MKGRRPTPPALKLIQNNPGKRALDADPNAIPAAIPSAPPHLEGAALEEWQRITTPLLNASLITELDRAPIAMYCDAWAEYLHADAMIKRPADQGGGFLVKTPNDYEVQSPWVVIRNKAFEKILKVGVEYGFTASARSRVHAMKQPGLFDMDPMEEFLKASQPKAG